MRSVLEYCSDEFCDDVVEMCSCHLNAPCGACVAGSKRKQMVDQALTELDNLWPSEITVEHQKLTALLENNYKAEASGPYTDGWVAGVEWLRDYVEGDE